MMKLLGVVLVGSEATSSGIQDDRFSLVEPVRIDDVDANEGERIDVSEALQGNAAAMPQNGHASGG
jgi:hypothetical protein